MPLRYKVLPEQRLLLGVFQGMLTPEEYLNGIDELAHNPDFLPDYDRLAILSDDLDLSNFSMDDILTIKDRMIAAYYHGAVPEKSATSSYRIAVVSAPSINEAMLKLYAATLTAAMLSNITTQTFLSLGEALDWLGHANLAETFKHPDWADFITVNP